MPLESASFELCCLFSTIPPRERGDRMNFFGNREISFVFVCRASEEVDRLVIFALYLCTVAHKSI